MTTLDKLAENARDAHAAYEKSDREAKENAFHAGLVLLKARKLIPHGNSPEGKGKWQAFLKQCGIPSRTVKRYMYIAKHRELWANSATVAEMGVKALERHIQKQRGDGKRKRCKTGGIDKAINDWEKLLRQVGDLTPADRELFFSRVFDDTEKATRREAA
jgi:hypothetical protein